MNEKKPELALMCCNQWSKMNPLDMEAIHQRILVYSDSEDYINALDLCSELIKKDKNTCEYYIYKA